jgi:transposase
MKKDTTAKQKQNVLSKTTKNQIYETAKQQRLTIGLDLGDRNIHYCILNEEGDVVSRGILPTTKTGLNSLFEKMPSSRVAMEVGTHSPWVSRQLAGLGHEVIVANAHRVKLITQSVNKNDRMDAEQLARLARVDPKLLSPIRHRGVEAQADLAVIRARAGLVDARTELINSARGLAKPMGERLKKCDADYVKESLADELSEATRNAIGPLLKVIEEITEQVRVYEQRIEEMGKRYPAVKLLKQVYGVGTLIALTFILTIEDAERFAHSREVGPYLGLTPKQQDSGDREPELGISKHGDGLVRRQLVQAAHCTVRQGAPDSDLKAWAMARLENGGKKKGSKKGKKKTIVAVARKLAVLLHHLLVTGEVYDPHYNRKAAEAAKAKANGQAA